MPIIPPNNTTGLYGIDTTVTVNNTVTGNNLNITGNAFVAGNITAGGILTDNYYYANGTPFDPQGTYSNVDVADFLASGSLSSNVITAGNISGNYILGNGSQLTGLPESYGNANVVALLAAFGSNTITTTGAVNTGSLQSTTVTSTGTVSATGNITGAAFVGSGAGLTNIPGANVSGTVANAAYATTSGSAGTSSLAQFVTGNAQGNITSVGTLTSLSVSGNVVGGNIETAGLVTATGNITGGNIRSSNFQAVSSAGGTLKNASGTTQASWGGGGGDNFSISVSTNINGANAQVDISPTGSGHVHIKPTGTGSLEVAPTNTGSINNMVIGNVTPAAVNATTVSASGNITGGNLITTGVFSTTGNIAANNISAANTVTAGSINTTGSTGNITGVNYITANFFQGDGSLLTNITATVAPAGSNTQVQFNNAGALGADVDFTFNTATNTLASPVITATGNITGGNIITGGNFVGSGSQLTNLPAGGSNTQIQFNNGGVFGGNSNMTFNTATGNIGLGNLVINADNLRDVNAINLNATPSPQRITVGTGYDGNFGANVDPLVISRGGTLAIADKYNIGNADSNMAQRLTTSTLYADMGGQTLTNNARRLQPLQGALYIGNGTQQVSTGPVFATATGIGGVVAVGNIQLSGTTLDLGGTATVSHAAGAQAGVQTGANATVGNAAGYISLIQPQTANTSTTTSALGFVANFGGTITSITAPTNVYGYYMPGTTNNHGITNANNWRRASNYYFLMNEDDVAQNRLGSLRRYHEFNGVSGTTSGALTIDKNNGQVQQVNLTGNVSSLSFSNFITSASDGTNTDEECDTVTIVFNQGSTGGYGVTFPTGSTFKYAGNITALQSTAANSVSLVSVSAVRISSTTTYLITISPGFV